MAGEWSSVRFAQLCDHSAFGPRFAGELYASDGNVATLRTTDISADGRIAYETMPLASLDLSRLQQHTLRLDDLVITRSGRIGTAALFKGFRLPVLPGAFLIRFRLKTDIADPLYYRYFFNSPSGQALLTSVATGSVQQNLNITSVHGLEVPVPPLSEQRSIAHVLGALDDKIELNWRMNETLGTMARTLFKSWFVDFDPVRTKAKGRNPGLPKKIADLFPNSLEDSELGEIPKGWKLADIGEIADVIDCLHAKKPDRSEVGRPFLQLNNIRDDGLIDMTDTYLVNEADYRKWVSRMEAMKGDCVITNVGRVGAVAQIPDGLNAALGRNMTGIRCKSRYPFPTFLVECLLSTAMREEIARKMDSGTILNALNVRNIPKLRLVLPHVGAMACFEQVGRLLRHRMEQILSESRTLASLRDTLMPKLMSGELRLDSSKVQALS